MMRQVWRLSPHNRVQCCRAHTFIFRKLPHSGEPKVCSISDAFGPEGDVLRRSRTLLGQPAYIMLFCFRGFN